MQTKTSEMTWTTFRQLVSFVRSYQFWVTLNLVASLASAIIDVFSGYFIKTITDAALNNQQSEILSTIYLIIATVVVVKYGVQYTVGYFSSEAVKDIRWQTTEQFNY